MASLAMSGGCGGSDEASVPERGTVAELNRRIDAIGDDLGIPVIGFHDALADPDEPATMRAALTADGDHPSVAGYRVLGELVARELTPEGYG